jgi:hypothetical protein
LLSPL